MNYGFIPAAQQSLHGPTLPGCWRLGAGRTIALRPQRDAVLRVAHGTAWVTLGRGGAPAAAASGDLFLGAGQELTMQAGDSVVLESSGAGAVEPVYFDWSPVPVTLHSRVLAAESWDEAVVQPVVEIRDALGMAARASLRLMAGVAALIRPAGLFSAPVLRAPARPANPCLR